LVTADSETDSGSQRNERTYGVSLRERGMDNLARR
jgi:hypothetical protein